MLARRGRNTCRCLEINVEENHMVPYGFGLEIVNACQARANRFMRDMGAECRLPRDCGTTAGAQAGRLLAGRRS
jgi:hypothetical protein